MVTFFLFYPGEEFVYTSWSNGEPNGDTQHCVTMNTQGEWQDRGCADVWKTICEKGKILLGLRLHTNNRH